MIQRAKSHNTKILHHTTLHHTTQHNTTHLLVPPVCLVLVSVELLDQVLQLGYDGEVHRRQLLARPPQH